MILAIDSAVGCAGWALVERRGQRDILVGTGVLRGVGWRLVRDFAAQVAAHGQVEVVGIEDAYLGENVDTLKVLCRLVGRWQQEFQRAGIRTHLVMAAEWQRGLLSGLIHERTPGLARKAAAITWVRSVYRVTLGPDEADAACLATWMCRQLALRAKVAAARLARVA